MCHLSSVIHTDASDFALDAVLMRLLLSLRKIWTSKAVKDSLLETCVDLVDDRRYAHPRLEVVNQNVNLPFTWNEVEEALNMLQNDKATADGFKTDLIKYAKVKDEERKVWTYLLVQKLLLVFNIVFIFQLPNEPVVVWSGY